MVEESDKQTGRLTGKQTDRKADRKELGGLFLFELRVYSVFL